MKYKLINPVNNEYSAIEQVLSNRGININDVNEYLNLTEDCTIHPSYLDNIDEGAQMFMNHLTNESKTLLLVDADADGYLSSAICLNWIYHYKPDYLNSIDVFLHEEKTHGFEDNFINKWIEEKYEFIICIDAGSNDYEQHKKLKDAGIDIFICDHHQVENGYSKDAIVINNQESKNYLNKSFCGGGVFYKFLKYLEEYYTSTNYADLFLDLVALSNVSDMMSQLSFETTYYIREGLKHVRNPYFFSMWKKNKFKLGEELDPMGVAFYITPFINAFTRSGTMDEKQLLFNSMLEYKAFNEVLSTKRGHALGETETLVDQACRVSTNVKNRQQKGQDAGDAAAETLIKQNNLLNHKVLLVMLNDKIIGRNIIGLLANRLMARHQRPCCVLIQNENENDWSGSARGCEIVGVTHFKDICEQSGCTNYCRGHESAFGISIPKTHINQFLSATDILLQNMETEPFYRVDYIFQGSNISTTIIHDIAKAKYLWGKDLDEPYIAVTKLKINNKNITLLSPDKSPTLKITTGGITIMKFNSSEDEYFKYAVDGYVEVDIIGRCNINEWMGKITPQIIVEQIEITDKKGYYF